MKRRDYWQVALTVVAAATLTGRANAGLMLTSAGTAQGFSLSTFATGFSNNGSGGPLGITFPISGGVLVADFPGNVRLFAADVDGQNASAAPVGQNYGANNALGLATVGNNIYMTQFPNGRVVQINSNGTFNQTIVTGLSGPAGIVANPTSRLTQSCG